MIERQTEFVGGAMGKSGRSTVGPLLATFATQTVAAVVLFGVAVIAPAAAPDIGVDANLIGTYTAITYATGMVAGLLTGAFTDRFGAIRVSQIIMIFALIGTALLTLSTLLAAIASAVMLGLCYGPVNPVTTHILARVAPETSRPLFFSIKQTGMPAGAAIAGILLPLVTAAYDWRLAILTAGIMAVLVALFIQPFRKSLDVIRQPKQAVRVGDMAKPLGLVWCDSRLRCLAVVGFSYSGAQVAMMTFYVVYLTAALALPLTKAGLIFTLLQLGAILGRLFWGTVADRYYPANLLLIWLGVATGAFAVTTSLYSPAWPFWVIGMTSFLLGTTSAGWNGVFFSELVKYAPAGRTGEAASGMQVFIMAGVVTTPPIFGAIVAVTNGYGVAFLMIAIAMVAAAVHQKFVFR